MPFAGRPKASLLGRGGCSQGSSGLTANSSFLVADAPNSRQTHAVTRPPDSRLLDFPPPLQVAQPFGLLGSWIKESAKLLAL